VVRSIKKLAPIPNLKLFKERNNSWYMVLKKLAPIPNLKMFQERND